MTSMPPRTGEEIDRVLAEALDTLEITDRQRRRLARLTTGSYLLAAASLTVTVAVSVRLSAPAGATVVVVMLLAAVAGLLWVQLMTRRRRADLRRRRQSMMAAVDDVREVFPLVARRERWTPTRRESVQARLSRFPVAVA